MRTLSACEAGAGIAQTMGLASKHLTEVGRLVKLFADWSGDLFSLCALYPSRHHRAANARAFIAFTSELLESAA